MSVLSVKSIHFNFSIISVSFSLTNQPTSRPTTPHSIEIDCWLVFSSSIHTQSDPLIHIHSQPQFEIIDRSIQADSYGAANNIMDILYILKYTHTHTSIQCIRYAHDFLCCFRLWFHPSWFDVWFFHAPCSGLYLSLSHSAPLIEYFIHS